MTDLCLHELEPDAEQVAFEEKMAQIKHNPDLPAAGRHLRRAAKVIEEFGWNRGSYGNKLHGFCIMGALTYEPSLKLRNWDVESWNTQYVLYTWLREQFPDLDFGSVEAWNDRYVSSQEDMMSYLRKAADDLDPPTW